MINPFEQECEYGTIRIYENEPCVYMPDPYTFPEGYGNAWVKINQLEKDGISYPKREETMEIVKSMTPERIRDLWLETLAERFCAMPLPEGVAADACACDPNYPHARSGTNLLTVAQAKEMLGKLI